MIRDTQKEAWWSIQDKLTEKQERVLAEITKAPATLFELSARLAWPINRLSGRVTELSDKGKIVPVGERTNPDSGRKGIVWGPRLTTGTDLPLFSMPGGGK